MIKVYSRVSEFGNTTRQKPGSLPKKEKLKVLIGKCTFLRIISPTFLALEFSQDSYQSNVRHPGEWMPV